MTEQDRRDQQDGELAEPANSSVRPVEIDIAARLKAARATDNAVASSRLAGLEPSPEDIATLRRIERGEITVEQAIAEALARHPTA